MYKILLTYLHKYQKFLTNPQFTQSTIHFLYKSLPLKNLIMPIHIVSIVCMMDILLNWWLCGEMVLATFDAEGSMWKIHKRVPAWLTQLALWVKSNFFSFRTFISNLEKYRHLFTVTLECYELLNLCDIKL